METAIEATAREHGVDVLMVHQQMPCQFKIAAEVESRNDSGGHSCGIADFLGGVEPVIGRLLRCKWLLFGGP